MSPLCIKDTDGNPSWTATFSLWMVLAVVIRFLLSGIGITIGTTTLTAGVLDGGLVAAVLTPTLGAYLGRRWTDRRYPRKAGKESTLTVIETKVDPKPPTPSER